MATDTDGGTVVLQLMAEVDGVFHHFHLELDGRPVARLTDEGFWADTSWLDDDQRATMTLILQAVTKRLGSALEGVLMARGALWRPDPEERAWAQPGAEEAKPTQPEAAA